MKLFSALLLTMVSLNTHAEVKIINEQVNYEVRQQENESLLSAMNRASPIRENGKRYHGNTQSEFGWNLNWNATPSGLCAINNVIITVKINMTLPNLTVSTREGSVLFERFLPALIRHENGHVKIIEEGANSLENTLYQLQPMPDCKQLEQEANQITAAAVENMRRTNAEYDLSTRHGCTQGACLPGS